MMFISEEFLCKHLNKCFHLEIISILKAKFRLTRNRSNKGKIFINLDNFLEYPTPNGTSPRLLEPRGIN